MQRLLGMLLVLIGVSSVASATVGIPEIDPASGASALALIAGGLLVIRGRRK